MTPPIRLRRHSDGRVAVLGSGDHRCVVDGDATYGAQGEICVSGPGWSELFVAELPEPDPAYIEGLTVAGWRLDSEELDKLRTTALKMLAAVATCERYRAEQNRATSQPATTPGP